ncbi:glycosyltransferase family 4 protein [Kroppenstedtia pulmonis]|uniref:Glycosyltransferase family 4 protein n=1 Tax=Kroppenstedtia pulmonis TaxID=1380685 RepID=A0A7D3XRD6_9BACL|nr:glycosyltransferase [Kroppenstedtia pulmonis]QKG85042.1 glycosyltransferase family 4 protein [Kroppenstedtia pulmonis]
MGQQPQVLAFCQATASSVQVGVLAPIKRLASQGLIDFKYRESRFVTPEDVEQADTIIIVRGTQPEELNIALYSKLMGKYLVYYLDDDLLNMTDLSRTYDAYQNKEIRQNIFGIMGQCDCLWSPSPMIIHKYKGMFSKTVQTHGVALLLEDTSPYFSKRKNGSPFVIGFAGGIDHELYMNRSFLKELIQTLKKRYSYRIRIEFVGAKPNFVDSLGIRYTPYQYDFQEYKRIMKNKKWDIGIAPLPDTPFHRCKYYNKYLEYGAIGAAGIYSDVHPYKQVVRSGLNGIMVENKVEDWLAAIRYLMKNPDVHLNIRQQARKNLEHDYTSERIAESFLCQMKNTRFFERLNR